MTEKVPVTQAIRVLRDHNIDFTPCFYKYEERGGSAVSSRELGVDEYLIVKTLIMETETKSPLIVLMHGDCEVSTKNLARLLNVKSVKPCDPAVADKHSGYQVGGTSPFGTKKEMPVYIQKSILDLPEVYINGGKRGFLVRIRSADVQKVLKGTLADIRA